MLHRVILSGLRGIAASIVYPLAERIEGRAIRQKALIMASAMAYPLPERRAESWAALIEIVHFAAANVPYYRDLFARIRFVPGKLLVDPRYLQDIPYLTKEIILREGERMLRDNHNHFRKHACKTGGSTGASAHIFYDQEAADWSSAITRQARATLGNTHFRSELHFASKFPDAFPLRDRLREYVKCLAMNRYNIFLSSYDPDELEAIWRKINLVRPYLVHAHPSTIYHLALHVRDCHGPSRAFRIFESSGEILDQRQRETISQVFLCDIINRYGLAEIGVVAYQINRHDPSLVVFESFVWPEVAPSEGTDDLPHHPGTRVGELILTGLKNRMMPLIRYRSGDVATLAETPQGLVIRELVGRVHDVVDIGGRRVPTHFIQDVLDRVGGIKTFQIAVRHNRPTLRLVPEKAAEIEAIRKRIRGWWGDSLEVEFIDASQLILQGWRSKFRQLVPPLPGDENSPPAIALLAP
jgi:phenylacetate-CoA ligase